MGQMRARPEVINSLLTGATVTAALDGSRDVLIEKTARRTGSNSIKTGLKMLSCSYRNDDTREDAINGY